MDPYEQYLADADYEDYLKQANAEDLNKAVQRGTRSAPPPFASGASGSWGGPDEQLGADYRQSIGGNIWKSIKDFPGAAYEFGKDAYQFLNPYADVKDETGKYIQDAGGPIDTIRRAGLEKTARGVGGIASGIAGAGALAPYGAGAGTFIGGPVGAAVGGVVGGGLGFGAGLLGFDLATDVGSEGASKLAEAGRQALGKDTQDSSYIRPTEQYIKDLAYNVPQAVLFGGAGEIAKLPYSGAKRLAEPFTSTGTDARVAAELEKLAPEYGTRIDEALAKGAEDPFLQNKSLGELIGSDIIKNKQRTLARGTPEGYGKASEAYKNRNDAQLKYLDQIESTDITPADVQAKIKSGIESDLGAKESGVSSAEGGVQSALSNLPAPIEPVEAGSLMREGVAQGLEAQRAKVKQGFEGAGNGIVDPSPVKLAIAEEKPKYFRDVGAKPDPQLTALFEGFSPKAEPTGILDANGQPVVREGPLTILDMQALRSQAINIIKNSDRRSAAVAGKIVKSIDKSFEEAIKSGTLSPVEVESLKAGIEARRTQGEIFESKGVPSMSVLGKEYSGNYTVPDSAVPSKFWRPGAKGTREAMQNYKRAFGASEDALEPIYRYATDSFRRAAVNAEGKVDIKKARNWLDQHAEALKEVPELKEQLGTVEKAQTFLNEKYGDLKRSQADVEKGALQLWLKDVDPKAAIKEMLSGQEKVKRTVSTTEYLKSKDPDALKGLRRGVIEYVKDKVFEANAKVSTEEASLPGGPRFDGLTRDAMVAKTWNDIKPALERSKMFTDSQMKGFDYLYRDKASQLSVEKAKMPNGADTFQNFSTLAAYTRAAGSGFLRNMPGGKWIAILEPILKAIPQAKFMAKLEEALLNPRIARDLAQKATAKNFARTAEGVFKEELNQAFGDRSPFSALGRGAMEAAPMLPLLESQPPNEPKKQKALTPIIPKQQQITSRKSFPNPNELLRPPAKGSLQKTSFDLESFIASQAPETRARIGVESSGDPFAVSPKGAQGLAQLMPDTAQDIAGQLGEKYMPISANMNPDQQRASIEQNVRFGDYYYKQQLKRFKQPTLAWAAYNAGPRRVQEAMAMAGSSTDVNKILSNLPKGVQKETIPYVNRIALKYGSA